MEKSSSLKEQDQQDKEYIKLKLEDSGVDAYQILPEAFPLGGKNCCVTFVFCKDDNNPHGLIVFAGSDKLERLTHQSIFELAVDTDVLDDESAEGMWGGHVNYKTLKLIRKSHGFPGDFDESIYDEFIDKITTIYH